MSGFPNLSNIDPIIAKKIKERNRVEKQLLKQLSEIKNIKQKLNNERNEI